MGISQTIHSYAFVQWEKTTKTHPSPLLTFEKLPGTNGVFPNRPNDFVEQVR